MANPPVVISKWDKLKLWVARRHDYLESQYKDTNFSADANELGAYRSVYQAMKDIEEQDAIAEAQAKRAPSQQVLPGVDRKKDAGK